MTCATRSRALARNPGFSLTVFTVLTLGIGLNATVFTLLKSLAFSPLAGVDGSASLAVVLNETKAGRQTGLSYPDYQYVRDHDRAFVGLFGSRNFTVNLGSGNRTEPIMGELVTGNYFHQLGVRAQVGRTVLPSDDVAPGQHPIVVLSDTLWKGQFGSDPDIVGTTIRINTYPLTVVGVAAPGFHGTIVGYDVEVFLPIMMTPQVLRSGGIDPQTVLSDRQAGFVTVMGRLRPGTARADASAQMTVLSSQLRRDTALEAVARELEVVPIWRSPFGAQTYMLPAVMVLSAMGALLLLIVCANITALVLARGISRRGEIALRLALGAGRGRVIRLLLVENVVLAVPAALVAIALVPLVIPALLSGISDATPIRLYLNLSVDRLVIAFSVLAACGSALVFGLLPALRSSGVDLLSVIEGRSVPPRRRAGTLPHGARRLAGGGVAVVADRRRVGHAKSRRGATDEPGIRCRQCDLVENRCFVRRVRPGPRAGIFCGAARPRARRPGHRIGDTGKISAADDGRSGGATGDDRRLHPSSR